jgi:RNA polymerase sigma-70 factor (ECF subfamily)
MRIPIDDEDIIDLYWDRDERAIEETDIKYHKYLFSIAYNILYSNEDCEECLDDTYMGAWNSMPPQRPLNLKAFLTVIARRVAINRYHECKT